jgi:hypothetical protein
MPSFNAEVSHQIGQEEAVQRLKTKFLDVLGDKYRDTVKNVQGTWTDNVLQFAFTSLGLSFKGTLEVGPDNAKIQGNLPFAAIAFKGKIEQTIKHEMEKALS